MGNRNFSASVPGGFALALLLFGSVAPVFACTLWAAAGEACQGGGTLIAKNRDWIPDQTQELRIIKQEGEHSYLGLYAVGSDEAGCKAGANDAGLVIISSTASSIPKAQRREEDATKDLIPKLLSTCTSVDAALAERAWFLGPRNLMLADGSHVAIVEIGPDGDIAIRRIDNGTIAHTNHYLYDQLTSANIRVGRSSRIRLARIKELLSKTPKPLRAEDFISFAADRRDGPTDGIFRIGDENDQERTMATFIARIAPDGATDLEITLYNPGQGPKRIVYSAAQFKALLTNS
jgi:hypothetical protein